MVTGCTTTPLIILSLSRLELMKIRQRELHTHQISLKNWVETEDFSCHAFSTNLSNFTPCVLLFSFLSVEIRLYLPTGYNVHESTLGKA